jgi:hypothetical protein
LKNWKMNPMWRRRSFVRSVSPSSVMSVPSIQTRAAGRAVEPGEQVHQRRLAGARRAHHGRELGRLDVERDAAERVDGGVALAEAARQVARGHDALDVSVRLRRSSSCVFGHRWPPCGAARGGCAWRHRYVSVTVMSTVAFDVASVRRRFSALDRSLAFFDGPGGTQVPDSVIDAIAGYLRESNANVGGPYETSRQTEALIDASRETAARWLGCTPEETIFGANMTTLNFALTRSLGRDLREGDEVVVTRLDHDANVAPWLELPA